MKKRVDLVVARILLSDNVPTDDVIIKRVRKESGSKKFNHVHLRVYKTRARKGRLPTQDGQQYEIKQKQAKRYR